MEFPFKVGDTIIDKQTGNEEVVIKVNKEQFVTQCGCYKSTYGKTCANMFILKERTDGN